MLLGTVGVHAKQSEGFVLQRCGASRDDDLGVGMEAGVGDVIGECTEVLQQGCEAVQWRAVVGTLGGVLGLGVGRAHRLGHGRGASGARLVDALIVEEHGFETLAHAPLDVVAEQAQEDVRAYALSVVVEDRAQVQVHGLH